MSPAPVALFAYNRPEHVREALEALRDNPIARDTDLYLFSDGPRDAAAAPAVEAVRAVLAGVAGFRRVEVIRRERNLGLAASIISGVTEVAGRHGRVIVLEDDHVTSPHFLDYMNAALDAYASDERVASVHAYTYPVGRPLPETFFLRGGDCWGWGTWTRAWKLFEPDGRKLLDAIRSAGLAREFDRGPFQFVRMLEDQIAGRNQSWAIRWHASAFVAGKLTLYPGRSLVQNIGHDAQGTHCRETEAFQVMLAAAPVRVGTAPVREDADALRAFIGYMRGLQPSGPLARIRSALRALVPSRKGA